MMMKVMMVLFIIIIMMFIIFIIFIIMFVIMIIFIIMLIVIVFMITIIIIFASSCLSSKPVALPDWQCRGCVVMIAAADAGDVYDDVNCWCC